MIHLLKITRRKGLIILLILSIYCQKDFGKIYYSQKDSLIFCDYIKKFSNKKNNKINQLIVSTALYFINTPYQSNTIDNNKKESLVIDLQEFDCTTYIETCMALSITIKSGNNSLNNFAKTLSSIRYRRGIINGYTSRLHYVSDWIVNNTQMGYLKNITPQTGGKKQKKIINYMSSHPQYYLNLLNNKTEINLIKQIESNINRQEHNTYIIIPKKNIKRNENKIHNGDIILFATDKKGLDYSHMGIALYNAKKELSFLNASQIDHKVSRSKYSLYHYCLRMKHCTGITLLRLNNKKNG